MIDLLWQIGLAVAGVAGVIWAAYSRGAKSESVKRDAADKQAEIDTMERINADNPYSGLDVDDRLRRHTDKR